MVTIKNNKTGVESEVSNERWTELKKDPFWNGVFSEVSGATPKEVKQMEANKTATTVGKAENGKK